MIVFAPFAASRRSISAKLQISKAVARSRPFRLIIGEGGASNALTLEALRRGKDFKVSRSKARRTSLNVLRGRGSKGNVLVTVYERERRSVVTAL